MSDLGKNLFQDSHINTATDHKILYFQYIAHIIRMLMNQFCSLKYFHATYSGPLRTSSGVFKQTVFTFTTTLQDTMDPLLIVMAYTALLKVTIFKHIKILVKH